MNATETELDEWMDGGLSVNEASEFAGVGRTTLYDWMNTGLIAYRMHGARRIVAKRSLVRRLSSGSPSRIEHRDHSRRES
jgi:predicted site-specific integrase-resolvase